MLDADYYADSIADAVQAQIRNGHYAMDDTYGDGLAGPRIADILANLGRIDVQKRITY